MSPCMCGVQSRTVTQSTARTRGVKKGIELLRGVCWRTLVIRVGVGIDCEQVDLSVLAECLNQMEYGAPSPVIACASFYP